MKKIIMALLLLVLGTASFSGEVGLPLERLAIPEVQGNHLVCIWDESAGTWLKDFESYDLSGVYEFQVPRWSCWYWIGIWDVEKGEYSYSKWIGHFLTD